MSSVEKCGIVEFEFEAFVAVQFDDDDGGLETSSLVSSYSFLDYDVRVDVVEYGVLLGFS
ncbi:hypothetical protein DERF_008217 [Dermatophagoides farinae]|uniref:Uncharacterized protein n=1 Tax=Dermatophagoides farinae TaxID=6954 RepID=A0A922I571_DERFA|nr:hypothetical protein DERF_008217 [Dermatophagoides farinae]